MRGAVLQREMRKSLLDELTCEQRPVCPEKIGPGDVESLSNTEEQQVQGPWGRRLVWRWPALPSLILLMKCFLWARLWLCPGWGTYADWSHGKRKPGCWAGCATSLLCDEDSSFTSLGSISLSAYWRSDFNVCTNHLGISLMWALWFSGPGAVPEILHF